MASLLICDDAVAFSTLLQHWLRTAEDLTVLGVARTADAAVEAAAATTPDVVILDHRLEGETSQAMVPRLRRATPRSRILLISGMSDGDLEAIARESGADGHLSKAVSRDRLVTAVRELAAR